MSSLLTNYSTDKLRAELDAAQAIGNDIFAELLTAEIGKREAVEAAEAAKRAAEVNVAANRELARQAWAMFHAVRWSDDPAVLNADGPAFKGAQRTVLFLLEHAYGLSAPKAKAALEQMLAFGNGVASDIDTAVEGARTDRRRNGTS